MGASREQQKKKLVCELNGRAESRSAVRVCQFVLATGGLGSTLSWVTFLILSMGFLEGCLNFGRNGLFCHIQANVLERGTVC